MAIDRKSQILVIDKYRSVTNPVPVEAAITDRLFLFYFKNEPSQRRRITDGDYHRMRLQQGVQPHFPHLRDVRKINYRVSIYRLNTQISDFRRCGRRPLDADFITCS